MFDEKLGFDPGPIATVQELLAIKVYECGDPLVLLDPDVFRIMSPEPPWLRRRFARMLVQAAGEMRRLDHPTSRLLIHYAHRNNEKQRQGLETALRSIRAANEGWTDEQILAEATRQWAHPDVAGHPTGSSVDISIWDDALGTEIPMPTKYDDFTNPAASYRKYPHATTEQKANALYLENLLVKRGIYPYPGEWWHFDLGNREWAWSTDNPVAIYGPIVPPTM